MGHDLPSVADEEQDPERAADFYRSATKALRARRRGSVYRILTDENAECGFRGNAGLRP
jgi:hypothetical protein